MTALAHVAYRPGWGEELRHFRAMVGNYADAAVTLHRHRGDVVRLRFPVPSLNLVQPRHLDHVLRTNFANYPKSEDYEKLHALLGHGIFVAEGDVWVRQRKLLSPEFRASVIGRYLPVMVRDLEALFAERWEPSVGGEPRDISDDTMALAIRVVGDTIFARDFAAQADAIGAALEVCLDQATFRMMMGGLLPDWLPTPGNRRAARAERELDHIVAGLIAATRAGSDQAGMLSRLLALTDEQGRPSLSDRQLSDEVKSMILAGHETTSLALAWTFYLLDQHPEVRARLEAEVDEVLDGRLPAVADLPRLSYTRMVFCEAMRLYPPVPVVTRRARAADVIDGYEVAAGEKVILHVYAAHRHPDHWAAPDEFRPERFAPDRIDTIAPGAWIPFLSGRRACLGEHFAMLEGIVVLAGMVSRYRLVRADHQPIGVRPISTLRLARPLRMRVTRRR